MIHRTSRHPIVRAVLVMVAAASALANGPASAQVVTGNIHRVGGVSIDTAGLRTRWEEGAPAARRRAPHALLKAPPAELKDASGRRLVPLKQIERAARESGAKLVEELPADLRFLAGLTRIQYVFIYPEEN